MATLGSDRTQPILLQKAEPFGTDGEARRAKPTTRPRGLGGIVFAVAAGAFWIGVIGAFLVGYFGLDGLAKLTLQEMAGSAAFIFIPPALFIVTAWAFAK